MSPLLADERLHQFIGGRPATLDELRDRYSRLTAGPTEPGQLWLNWILRRRQSGAPVGTMQATVFTTANETSTAEVAWVIASPWQGQGLATEAACALVAWLRRCGVGDVVAHIHPSHFASAAVARHAGFRETNELHEGETVWRLARP